MGNCMTPAPPKASNSAPAKTPPASVTIEEKEIKEEKPVKGPKKKKDKSPSKKEKRSSVDKVVESPPQKEETKKEEKENPEIKKKEKVEPVKAKKVSFDAAQEDVDEFEVHGKQLKTKFNSSYVIDEVDEKVAIEDNVK